MTKKIFEVDFSPMWPVPSGLIIVADDLEEAKAIAKDTVSHTEVRDVTEVDVGKSGVIFYESGDY